MPGRRRPSHPSRGHELDPHCTLWLKRLQRGSPPARPLSSKAGRKRVRDSPPPLSGFALLKRDYGNCIDCSKAAEATYNAIPAATKAKPMADFWRGLQDQYRHLAPLGMWYAEMPTSSVSAERLFAVMRSFKGRQRHRLSHKHVRAELMAKFNSGIVSRLERLMCRELYLNPGDAQDDSSDGGATAGAGGGVPSDDDDRVEEEEEEEEDTEADVVEVEGVEQEAGAVDDDYDDEEEEVRDEEDDEEEGAAEEEDDDEEEGGRASAEEGSDGDRMFLRRKAASGVAKKDSSR